MDHNKYRTILWSAFHLLIGILLMAWPPLPTQAESDLLPSWETSTPSHLSNNNNDNKDNKPVGAYTIL